MKVTNIFGQFLAEISNCQTLGQYSGCGPNVLQTIKILIPKVFKSLKKASLERLNYKFFDINQNSIIPDQIMLIDQSVQYCKINVMIAIEKSNGQMIPTKMYVKSWKHIYKNLLDIIFIYIYKTCRNCQH